MVHPIPLTGAAFLTNARTEWLPRPDDERPWWQIWGAPKRELRLLSDLLYRSADGRLFRVPAGTTTDLASVPKLLPGAIRFLMGGPIESGEAAIIHDAAYRDVLVEGGSPAALTRRQADALFAECLEVSGEAEVGEWVHWAGVRAGGFWAWHRNRGWW